MLAILYILLCVFFGCTLVRTLIPDMRRFLVACTPNKNIMKYIPERMFIIPTGAIVGIMSASFVSYYITLILSYIITGSTTCKRIGLIATCVLLVYLTATFCLKFYKNASKKDKTASLVPSYKSKSGTTWFYDIVIVAIFVIATILFFYTYKIVNGNLEAGYSVFSDLSPHTAMTSSFGVGFNFPTQYMHFSGDGIQYHFFFYYFCGVLQYLGLSLDFAINLPSIISMVSALTLLGLLAVLLTGRRLAFFFSPILVLFRSSLNFFSEVSRICTDTGLSWLSAVKNVASYTTWYGKTEFDKWGIWSINVYANQRHLMFGVSIIIILIILFLPHLRRMSIGFTKVTSFKTFLHEFVTSKYAWLWHSNDKIHPYGSLVLAGILVILMPYFHGSALIAGLLILLCMAIFSQARLGYLIVAVVAIASSFIQTALLSGGAQNVVYMGLNPGFTLESVSASTISAFILNVSGFTLILGFVFAVILLVVDIVKKRPIYRFLLFISFLFPGIFAFIFQVSCEVLANHKYIQITLILVDIFVAGFLANLFVLPFSIKTKENTDSANSIASASKEEAQTSETAPTTVSEPISEPVSEIVSKTNVSTAPESGSALSIPLFITAQVLAILLALVLLVPLTITGISEWKVYYNLNKQFISVDTNSDLTEWIVENTAPDDVFLTPYWSLDRFFLAGRASYFGWPYYAYSAGHDTTTRMYNYDWLVTGCNNNYDEFLRYCKERNIKYLIADDEFYTYMCTYNSIGYNADFFAQYLTPVAYFAEDGNTIVYQIY